ncbi:MAG: hypothetical protein SGJ02_07435 [bacterium]|nr:hypothetical protein [bacterium]
MTTPNEVSIPLSRSGIPLFGRTHDLIPIEPKTIDWENEKIIAKLGNLDNSDILTRLTPAEIGLYSRRAQANNGKVEPISIAVRALSLTREEYHEFVSSPYSHQNIDFVEKILGNPAALKEDIYRECIIGILMAEPPGVSDFNIDRISRGVYREKKREKIRVQQKERLFTELIKSARILEGVCKSLCDPTFNLWTESSENIFSRLQNAAFGSNDPLTIEKEHLQLARRFTKVAIATLISDLWALKNLHDRTVSFHPKGESRCYFRKEAAEHILGFRLDSQDAIPGYFDPLRIVMAINDNDFKRFAPKLGLGSKAINITFDPPGLNPYFYGRFTLISRSTWENNEIIIQQKFYEGFFTHVISSHGSFNPLSYSRKVSDSYKRNSYELALELHEDVASKAIAHSIEAAQGRFFSVNHSCSSSFLLGGNWLSAMSHSLASIPRSTKNGEEARLDELVHWQAATKTWQVSGSRSIANLFQYQWTYNTLKKELDNGAESKSWKRENKSNSINPIFLTALIPSSKYQRLTHYSVLNLDSFDLKYAEEKRSAALEFNKWALAVKEHYDSNSPILEKFSSSKLSIAQSTCPMQCLPDALLHLSEYPMSRISDTCLEITLGIIFRNGFELSSSTKRQVVSCMKRFLKAQTDADSWEVEKAKQILSLTTMLLGPN